MSGEGSALLSGGGGGGVSVKMDGAAPLNQPSLGRKKSPNTSQSAVGGGGGGGGGAAVAAGSSSSSSGGGVELKRPLRVLFMHGLESSPYSKKYHQLRQAGFDVMCVDMAVWLLPLRKPRTVKHLLACIGVALVLAAYAGVMIWLFATARWIGGLVMLVCGVSGGWVGFRCILQLIIRKCIKLQLKAMREFEPDVIVGLSFGGALATYLLLRQDWNGPTLLMCPAGSRLQGYARWGQVPYPLTLEPLNHVKDKPTIHVVHSIYDKVS